MAKAVESSQCVLMCVTEKYRQSLNCQSEAQYAFRLNKKIIPLIMQKGYGSVDGWLGFIIGDKIFVDFTKYTFEDCLKRVVNQLILINANSVKNNKIPNLPIEIKVNRETCEAKSWDEINVEKWLNENDLKVVYDALKPLNGKVLYQMYQLQTYTPEFFFKSLTKTENVDIKSVAFFSSLLKDLFDE